MNQLSLKKSRFSFIIIAVCILSYSFDSSKKYKQVQQDPFLKICQESDAYYKYSYVDITYQKNWSRYKKYISINNKLVVNNKNGIENYAFLNLDEYESNHINSIKIRTLKADGSIIELDSSLVFSKKTKSKRFEAINYPIPAVEPGDTIETNYVYYENLKKSELSSYVNLNNNLPSLNSQYTIKTGPEFLVRYKTYNNFPEPQVVNNDSLIYLQFSLEKVKGFQENEYSCFPCELPYLYYSLDKKGSELRSWKDVYEEEFNFFTQPMAIDLENSTYYKRWKKRVIGKAKDSSKFYKLNLIYDKILSDFNISFTKQHELIKSSGYFLKEKTFDPISIRRFYRQTLEELDIDYWAVFAKNKRSGKIDFEYIRKGEFQDMFFAIENERGSLSFLYPHTQFYKFQIDEIPTYLYNTNAILVKPFSKTIKKKKDKFISRNLNFAKVDSVTTVQIKLPGMNANYNRANQIVYGKVDLKNKKVTCKSRYSVSGGLSSDVRGFISEISKDEETSNFYNALFEFEKTDSTIQIDTVIKRHLNKNKPFTFIVDSEGTLNNTISFINGNLLNLSVDKLINHNQLQSDFSKSDLDYYLDYTYSDNFQLLLEFPYPLEILGIENGTINFKNYFGEYDFELKKMSENQIILKSSYRIIKNFIPKEDYNKLKLLNQQVKMAKNNRFIIKLKK